MYKLIKTDKNKQFYINNNNTILYLYDKKLGEIKRIFRDKWVSMKLEILDTKNNEKLEVDIKTITEKENDFIKNCEVISSTLKPRGFFNEKDNFNIKYNYLNEFLGSKTFLKSQQQNKYNSSKSIMELLEVETPTIFLLLKNLFYNENNNIIINFINWLNVVSFQDKNQYIIWNFFGTNKENQGQGRGKGILIKLLNKIFSGLVVSVSNTNYMNNFNSNLMNKKIVVFDEVNYKNLKYETIKDITGNPLFRVEYKGKEPISSQNVSSWLMFSNEYDLFDKITVEDRRTFLIRPNPKNGSLKERIIDKFFNKNYNEFEKKLFEEVDNFIHIISLCSNNKVLSPLELQTNRHKEYFREKRQVSVSQISDLYNIFINKNFKKRLLEILDTLKKIDFYLKNDIEKIEKILSMNFINYSIFKKIFDLLQKNDYISKSQKLNKEWEIMKENLLKYNFKKITLKTRKTKIYDVYRDTIYIKKDEYELNKTKINSNLRLIFGRKIEDIPPFD